MPFVEATARSVYPCFTIFCIFFKSALFDRDSIPIICYCPTPTPTTTMMCPCDSNNA
jgi:hypothetical protein